MNRRGVARAGKISLCIAVLVLFGGLAQAAPAAPVNVLVAYYSVTGNTEKMAQGVAEGAKTVADANVVVKKIADVAAEDLLSADAVIVGSPVYFANMAGDVKSFFDNWALKFGVFRDFKMRNKVGGAFATGASISNGKELMMLAILEAMLVNQMIIVSGGGAFGASATTGPDSPGIDDKELSSARDLGKRVAEVAAVVKRGSGS